jgi:hypothetical protein
VPWYLARLDPAATVVAVGVLEVPRDMPADPAPADLMPGDVAAGAAPAFDLLVFTPALEDVDPCEKFRAQLERMRDRHADGDGQDAASE